MGDSEKKTRTHLMIGKKTEYATKRRARRPMNRLRDSTHTKHDAIVQTTANAIDPTEWTGNQRVLHFGPLAQRDPFFYYYPKGWDILYPAQFGFFPYRTRNFRGSSPTRCLSIFGFFIMIAGGVMCAVGYAVFNPVPPIARAKMMMGMRMTDREILSLPLTINPVQVVGPALVVFGLILMLTGVCWWACSLGLCSTPHSKQVRRVTTTRYVAPPTPNFAIIANQYTQPSIFSPHNEMKLFPPVAPSHSMMSLAQSSTYQGGAYNTLQQPKTRTQHASSRSDSLPPNVQGNMFAQLHKRMDLLSGERHLSTSGPSNPRH